ncbi:DUF5675 family protein [Pseudodesulfovibrio sp.]|uniref:DUF5675 family protein n=1 Tax=unclassified Pseudodesulfovibrio TaxID=2661612 RepID=UPI003B00A601
MHKKSVTIVRVDQGLDGTFGRMFLPGGTDRVSAEPPWKDNRLNASCIPPGIYECEINESPHFGLCPEVLNVPDRTHVRMHAGNWAGDVEQGRRSDSKACILPGQRFAVLQNQQAVSGSRAALAELMNTVCDGNPRPGVRFDLEIIDATGEAGKGWNDGTR